MKSTHDIVKAAGGASAVARASKASPKKVTNEGVWGWHKRGVIPDIHWDLLIALAAKRGEAISLDDLHKVNRRSPSRRRSKSSAAVAA